MNTIQTKIMKLLSDGKERSEYEIAKQVGISWGTAANNLLRLALDGASLKNRKEENNTGDGHKSMWRKVV